MSSNFEMEPPQSASMSLKIANRASCFTALMVNNMGKNDGNMVEIRFITYIQLNLSCVSFFTYKSPFSNAGSWCYFLRSRASSNVELCCNHLHLQASWIIKVLLYNPINCSSGNWRPVLTKGAWWKMLKPTTKCWFSKEYTNPRD